MIYFPSVPSPTSVSISPSSTVTIAGSPVTLTCTGTLPSYTNYQSSISVTVEYLRSGTVVATNSSVTINNDGSLTHSHTISSLSVSSVGQYSCRVNVMKTTSSALILSPSPSFNTSYDTTVKLVCK